MCDVKLKDQVREHFDRQAKDFDALIVRLIPYYEAMVKATVDAIPFDSSDAFDVIDLGCGTGNLSGHLLSRFPRARLTCLDFAENMVAVASERLKRYSVRPFVADLSNWKWDQSYDVVMTSLALHHLRTVEEKQTCYQTIFKHLKSGGIFCNADIVLGANDHIDTVNQHAWKRYMLRSVPDEEIETVWFRKYRSEDFPATTVDQLHWIKQAGFSDVDVIWKYYNVAVYCGFR